MKIDPAVFEEGFVEVYRDYTVRKPGRPWYFAYPPGRDRASAQALELGTLHRLIDRQLDGVLAPRAKPDPTVEPAALTGVVQPTGKLCECGCGEPVKTRGAKFRMGHNMRKQGT